MKAHTKRVLRRILPPILTEMLKGRRSPWRGDYPTWETACAKASGYASADILKKVAEATEQVISGKAAYERDSVVFDQIVYSWPVLAGLLRVAARNGSLEVLDFGGSLGSSYRQNMRFLKDLPHHWNIVEQENYVTLGKARFETETLRFYRSIEECLGKGNINAFFSSSTLQYLENPMDFLGELSCFEVPTLILDRVSIIASDQNRLTLQTVPKEIYEASYPCWFFSEKRLFDAIGEKYRLVEKFESFIKNEAWIDGSVHSSDWGYIFELKN